MRFPTSGKTAVAALVALPLAAVVLLSIVSQQNATSQTRVKVIDPFALQPIDGFVAIVAPQGQGAARYPGYARTLDLQPPKSVGSKLVLIEGKEVRVPDIPNAPVYAKDLKTIVGHIVMGIGFVPIGTDLSTLSPFEQKNPPPPSLRWGTIPK